ncbi:hypothetical protein ACFX13_047229 [Malus domestica]|uniref:F-box protein CPR1-like n=1 Tax=Malus domestica TaxID=3750 RepID=UPI00049897B9|nr:F-box protein CPR1-like [Malus domestica]
MNDEGCTFSEYLPEEILVNILVRLPVKSLVRFTCVCKFWSDLIQSSRFIGKHLHRNVTNHAHSFVIALYESTSKPKISYTLLSNETMEPCLKIKHPLSGYKIDVHGSVDGLVCLSYELGDLDTSIYLCNLSIRKHVVLPPTSTLSRHSDVCFTVSFGFHPGLNDYKVVRMVSFNGGKLCSELEVYSLSTKSWKRIDNPLVKTMAWQSGNAVCNGVAYWIMQKQNGTFCFVSFDTGSEVFEEFWLPDVVLRGINSGLDNYKELIAEYKGSVCLLQSNITRGPDLIGIWALKEKAFKALDVVLIPQRKSIYPLSFRMNNKLLVGWPCADGKNYMTSVDLEARMVTETRVTLALDRLNEFHAYTYVESLVLLKD